MNFLTRFYKNYQLRAAGKDERYVTAAGLRRDMAKGEAIPQTIHLAGSSTWAYLDHVDLGDRTLVCHHPEFGAHGLTVKSLVHQPGTDDKYAYMDVENSHIETITTKGVSDIAVKNVPELGHLTTDAAYIKGENLPALTQLDVPPLQKIGNYRMIDCPHLQDTGDIRHFSLPHPKTGEHALIDVITDGQYYVMDYFKGTKQELLDDARPDFSQAHDTVTLATQAATLQIAKIKDDMATAQQTAVETYHQGYAMFNALQAMLGDNASNEPGVPNPAALLNDTPNAQALIGMEVARRRQDKAQPGPS